MKEQVAEIVAAYVRKNRVDPSALPDLIASVSRQFLSAELSGRKRSRAWIAAGRVRCLSDIIRGEWSRDEL